LAAAYAARAAGAGAAAVNAEAVLAVSARKLRNDPATAPNSSHAPIEPDARATRSAPRTRSEVLMRKVVPLALVAALLGALLVAGPALSKTKSVEVDDNYFVHEGAPRTVTVHKGDKVEWEWEGRNPHNVTVTKGPVKFNSKTKTSGTFEKTLKKTGTYKIICTIHAPDMRMTLKVVK
jgi:plastocyanin